MDTVLIATIACASILFCNLLILALVWTVCCSVRPPKAEAPEKVYAFQIPELPVQRADTFHA